MHFLYGAFSQVFSFSSLSGVVGTGLIAAVVVWTVKLLLRHAYYTHRLSCFSTPPVHSWLIGHLGQMQSTEEGLQQVDELVKTYKHSCSWFFGPFYHLVRIFHPDFVKPLLMASAMKFLHTQTWTESLGRIMLVENQALKLIYRILQEQTLDSSGNITVKDDLVYKHLRPWLGHSLLISNGEEWARRRRLLTPAFHFDILKNYIATFNTSANTMHEKWRRMLTDGKLNLEMFHDVTLMTLDSLLKCAFSYNSNCQESTSEYVSAIVELSDLIVNRRLKIWHHWDWIYWNTQQGRRFKKALSIVHRFTREVVQKRRITHQRMIESQLDLSTAAQRRKDFVDIILSSENEDGQGLTNEDVEAEANTFMFAGHDTTASAICWTLYNLARHDHYQEKCRQEVMDLVQGRGKQEIEWEDLSNLPFTTMCIRESLRLHSPVQAVTRKYTQDILLPGNRTVPKGVICLISLYGTHHNPAVWSNPHEFYPLRFDPNNPSGCSASAFIPFSAGPRNCIGQKFALAELRVVVALTLLRFRLAPGVNLEVGSTSGDVRRLPQLVLRAEGGLWLQLEPQNLEKERIRKMRPVL